MNQDQFFISADIESTCADTFNICDRSVSSSPNIGQALFLRPKQNSKHHHVYPTFINNIITLMKDYRGITTTTWGEKIYNVKVKNQQIQNCRSVIPFFWHVNKNSFTKNVFTLIMWEKKWKDSEAKRTIYMFQALFDVKLWWRSLLRMFVNG